MVQFNAILEPDCTSSFDSAANWGITTIIQAGDEKEETRGMCFTGSILKQKKKGMRAEQKHSPSFSCTNMLTWIVNIHEKRLRP